MYIRSTWVCLAYNYKKNNIQTLDMALLLKKCVMGLPTSQLPLGLSFHQGGPIIVRLGLGKKHEKRLGRCGWMASNNFKSF